MKAGENLFDKYHQWKKDRITLAFELSRFEGVSTDEVIESIHYKKSHCTSNDS